MKHITADQIRQEIKEKNVHFLRLTFSDVNGNLKNVEVPVSQTEKVLSNQMMFDGSSIDGFVRIEESDMYLVPDLNTWLIFPWSADDGKRIGMLICDIYTTSGEPFSGDPRGNLKRMVGRLQENGFKKITNLPPKLMTMVVILTSHQLILAKTVVVKLSLLLKNSDLK